METMSITTSRRSIPLTLHADGYDRQSTRTGRGGGKIAVQASTLSKGESLTASANCFIALVQVAPASSASLAIVLPDGSHNEITCHTGDMCLLPPGSVVTNLTCSSGELIQYRISQVSIRAFASQRALLEVDSLAAPNFGADSTMMILSKTVSTLLSAKQGRSLAVAEYFTLSLYSHLLDRYGVACERRERLAGGLSPRHKRIINETLSAPLDRGITIEDMAKQCGLSAGHFARAFRQSFGSSFHKHLLHARVERAKQLLLTTGISLRDVASRVGYADQTTFTECFTREAGMSPGRYRRRFAEDHQ